MVTSGRWTTLVPPDSAPARGGRRRHRTRWVAGGVLIVAALIVASVLVYGNSLSEAPLALPSAAAPPAGPLDGAWKTTSGSIAGFRVRQTVLFSGGDVTGRTEAVTGTAVVSGGQVTAATWSVDLTTIASGGKRQPQFATSLDTKDYPSATFTLGSPVTLSPAFATGQMTALAVAGHLAMHGRTRDVTAAVSARRDGARIELAGTITVVFADWGIVGPDGFGPLASVADRGSAEFLLVLDRA